MRQLVILLFVIGLSIFALAKSISTQSYSSNTRQEGAQSAREDVLGRVGPFVVEISDEPKELARGLSFRKSIADGRGMLFVFDNDGFHSMWMKDMNFSIDIAWLDKKGKVVHIEREVSPLSYPETFTSDVPARYVLEVGKGQLEANSVDVGDVLRIR